MRIKKLNKEQKETINKIAKNLIKKQKVAINGFSEYMSDYIFNSNYSFKELDVAYELAKLKLRKERQELYNKVN